MSAPVVERRRRTEGAGRPAACLLLAMGGLAGCGLGGGSLPMLPVGSDSPGFKMLQPDAQARACGAVVWPYGPRAGGGLLQEAVAGLVAQSREADTIRDLHLSWRGIDLLIAQIGCVSVSGDVGRTISTVTLPHIHPGMGGPHPE